MIAAGKTMNEQAGVSITMLLIVLIALALAAVAGMKVGPAYMEYAQIKKSVADIVQSGEARTASVSEIRKSFDRRAQINDISVITGQDLDISKDGGDVVIAFAYPKKVALFSNMSLLIEFEASSK